MKFVIVLACVLLLTQCGSLPVEDSVVSVYTTQSTTAGTSPSLDVYHQIANNIAERITSPIYRFLGLNSTTAATEASTKAPWDKIELLDDQSLDSKHDMKPVNNDIGQDRDVEELSIEGLTKVEKKPEKFTLYSSLIPSYLPTKSENNTTVSPDDFNLDSIELSDDEPEKPREGPLIYVMEFIGSILQLLWGGFMAIFKPPAHSDAS